MIIWVSTFFFAQQFIHFYFPNPCIISKFIFETLIIITLSETQKATYKLISTTKTIRKGPNCLMIMLLLCNKFSKGYRSFQIADPIVYLSNTEEDKNNKKWLRAPLCFYSKWYTIFFFNHLWYYCITSIWWHCYHCFLFIYCLSLALGLVNHADCKRKHVIFEVVN